MYGIEDIKKVLPHREPFLLIDKILKFEEGKSAVGLSNISIKDAVFRGHFPDEAIYPGVLIVEAMAQVGAFAILSDEKNKGKKAYFTKITDARFLKPVRPGDTMEIETKLITQRLNFGNAESSVKVGEKEVARAKISFYIGE